MRGGRRKIGFQFLFKYWPKIHRSFTPLLTWSWACIFWAQTIIYLDNLTDYFQGASPGNRIADAAVRFPERVCQGFKYSCFTEPFNERPVHLFRQWIFQSGYLLDNPWAPKYHCLQETWCPPVNLTANPAEMAGPNWALWTEKHRCSFRQSFLAQLRPAWSCSSVSW